MKGKQANPDRAALNENQKRHFFACLAHLHERVTELEGLLTRSPDSDLFARYVQDTTPIQRTTASRTLARLRAIIRRTLVEEGLQVRPPECGTVWAARGRLLLLLDDIQDIGPERLRGYGFLAADAALRLDRLRTELHDHVVRLADCLAGDCNEPGAEERLSRKGKPETRGRCSPRNRDGVLSTGKCNQH